MPRTNYQFEKRQRDLAKKKKKEEKRQRKLDKSNVAQAENPDATAEDTVTGGDGDTEPGNNQ
jgi:hypothetical protein